MILSHRMNFLRVRRYRAGAAGNKIQKKKSPRDTCHRAGAPRGLLCRYRSKKKIMIRNNGMRRGTVPASLFESLFYILCKIKIDEISIEVFHILVTITVEIIPRC